MFFSLSKIVSTFIYPVPLILLLLLAVWCCYRWRYGRWALAVVALLLYGFSAPVTATRLAWWVETPPLAPQQLRSHYDVAIVLTGMVNLRLSSPQRLEFNSAVERILTGMSLVKRGVADKLLISGSTGDFFGRGNEARLLQGFALEWGLAPEQIMIEEQSRNTYENALYSSHVLHSAGAKTFLLVTSSLHMRRAAACFHKQGLFPDLYPVDFYIHPAITLNSFFPSVDVLGVSTAAIHEFVGLVMYRLQGYL